MIKNNIDWIVELIVIIGVVGGLWWFVGTSSDIADIEDHQHREEFCDSFLEKDSALYGRCMDNAVDYF